MGVVSRRSISKEIFTMWRAGVDVKHSTDDADDDAWETDPDFVNDVSEQEQRWGSKTVEGSGHQGSLSMNQLRQQVEDDHKKIKQDDMDPTKVGSYGYGGKYGVQKDRVDKV